MMKTWKTVLLTFAILGLSENEMTVKNLSCSCRGKGGYGNATCPVPSWPQEYPSYHGCQQGGRCAIKVAVILPRNTSYVTSLAKVVPALYLAVEDAKAKSILPKGVDLVFTQYDDQCKADEGQISAIEAYANNRPHVIFGPTCEYSVEMVRG